MVRNILAAISAFALAAAPVAAQAADRQSSPVSSKEDVAGVSTVWILVGLVAVAVAIILIADDNNDNPSSP